MRFLRLILVLALFLGLGAAGYAFLGGEGPFRREITASEEANREVATERRTDKDEAGAPAAPPAFDVVRVEETGAVVAAGTAPPGWRVFIETPERTLGAVTAEFDGTWVFMPANPLPAGEHSLSLRASAPDGSREVVGAQQVAVSVAGQEPAVVAVSEDDKATRVLQSGVVTESGPRDARGAEKDGEAKVAVGFSAVDYKDQQQTGRLSMSGTATPGARIALYIDNRFIGSAQASASGAWQFSITDILKGGEHVLRADHVDMAGGDVLSRAEVRFDHTGVELGAASAGETRTALSVKRDAVNATRAAQPGDAGSPPAEAVDSGSGAAPAKSGAHDASDVRRAPDRPIASRAETPDDKAQQALRAAGEPDTQATEADSPARPGEPARRQAIVVRRGDTLWHIAEQVYGSGVRYTQIFRSNRDQIRNPHRIYPGQRFDLPQ